MCIVSRCCESFYFYCRKKDENITANHAENIAKVRQMVIDFANAKNVASRSDRDPLNDVANQASNSGECQKNGERCEAIIRNLTAVRSKMVVLNKEELKKVFQEDSVVRELKDIFENMDGIEQKLIDLKNDISALDDPAKFQSSLEELLQELEKYRATLQDIVDKAYDHRIVAWKDSIPNWAGEYSNYAMAVCLGGSGVALFDGQHVAEGFTFARGIFAVLGALPAAVALVFKVVKCCRDGSSEKITSDLLLSLETLESAISKEVKASENTEQRAKFNSDVAAVRKDVLALAQVCDLSKLILSGRESLEGKMQYVADASEWLGAAKSTSEALSRVLGQVKAITEATTSLGEVEKNDVNMLLEQIEKRLELHNENIKCVESVRTWVMAQVPTKVPTKVTTKVTKESGHLQNSRCRAERLKHGVVAPNRGDTVHRRRAGEGLAETTRGGKRLIVPGVAHACVVNISKV